MGGTQLYDDFIHLLYFLKENRLIMLHMKNTWCWTKCYFVRTKNNRAQTARNQSTVLFSRSVNGVTYSDTHPYTHCIIVHQEGVATCYECDRRACVRFRGNDELFRGNDELLLPTLVQARAHHTRSLLE